MAYSGSKSFHDVDRGNENSFTFRLFSARKKKVQTDASNFTPADIQGTNYGKK